MTTGNLSDGLFAQSIGGGGGNGGFSVAGNVANSNGLSAALGGFGAGGGNSGSVTLVSGQTTTANTVETGGLLSDAILAQSIGGGGGNGGWSVAGTIDDGKGASLGMGGSGGGAGNGGDVSLTANTVVTTTGDQSAGIAAQSIGGGGGTGGFSVTGALSNSTNATLAFGGGGGGGGNGGTVNLTSGQNVQTQGSLADALLAQSSAAAAVTCGFSIAAGVSGESYDIADSFGGNGGSAGNSDVVTVTDGTAAAPVKLTTGGVGSDGLLAQSIGGGGGNGGFNRQRLRVTEREWAADCRLLWVGGVQSGL